MTDDDDEADDDPRTLSLSVKFTVEKFSETTKFVAHNIESAARESLISRSVAKSVALVTTTAAMRSRRTDSQQLELVKMKALR